MEDPSERLGADGIDSIAAVKTDDLSMEIDPPFQENAVTAEDWRKSLRKVVPAVVVLRITATRAFDTESASASSATGFVVDKRRGIILTNRHVVKPGKLVTVHSFAFLQFGVDDRCSNFSLRFGFEFCRTCCC
jgi:pro-apoptotic serine protease NMA111